MKKLHVHLPYPRLLENLETVTGKRLDLEILFEASVLDHIKKEEIKSLLKALNYGPSITYHAPFVDMSPGSPDTLIKKVTFERFEQLLEIAELIPPVVIVFHPGFDKWRFDGKYEIWLDNCVPFWKKILNKARRFGIKVAIENVFEENPRTLRMLLDRIDEPDFGICFDIGHHTVFSKVPLEDWFESLGNKILEVHLHDNRGKADEHLGVGEGVIDFKRFFELLAISGSDPVLTIEGHSKEAIEKSLATLPKYL